MKKSKIVLLTAVIGLTSLICAGSVCAFADTTETAAGIDNAHLIVIGCADVQGEADECVISGSIEAIGNDMAGRRKKERRNSRKGAGNFQALRRSLRKSLRRISHVREQRLYRNALSHLYDR